MIIQEKKLVLTVCQDYLRNYRILHPLQVIALLPSDHGQSREKLEKNIIRFMMNVFYAVYMHAQGFKIILVHLNAHVFQYCFHGLTKNDDTSQFHRGLLADKVDV